MKISAKDTELLSSADCGQLFEKTFDKLFSYIDPDGTVEAWIVVVVSEIRCISEYMSSLKSSIVLNRMEIMNAKVVTLKI